MWLDASTVSLAAFLLFQIQPMIAAYILPWFGGTAAVWTVCILFFQTALLGGYAYGHLLARGRSPRVLAVLHTGLLLGSLALLPIVPNSYWQPAGDDDPVTRILALLATTIGLPYFLLSTTGPLVQAWAFRRDPRARPYRLFALGNLAALLALVAYPFVVQPALGVSAQIHWWSWAYGAYVGLGLVVTVRSVFATTRIEAPEEPAMDGAPAIAVSMVLLWIALAACPSVLFLAVTDHLTRDVAPVPFLWVLPLSIYLFSLVLAFDHPRWYRARPFRLLVLLGFAAIAFGLSTASIPLGVRGNVALFAGALFVLCMTCHGELAALKPPPRQLTIFYLLVALGGALGGVFVALVAPHVFVTLFELPLAVAGCLALVVTLLYRETPIARRKAARRAVLASALAVGCFLWGEAGRSSEGVRLRARNFFGTLTVRDTTDPPAPRRVFSHGVVIHGVQLLQEDRRREPTSYCGHRSGVGRALDRLGQRGALRVGVVGLGAGVLAAYGRAGDFYRFYEINPLVVRLASSEFTFLADAQSTNTVIVGDGRLALEREPNERFDVLVVDAFSGDSIPVHLLTREAFEIYFRHLGPGGVLMLHVTNSFLDLRPVVAAVARAVGRTAFFIADGGDATVATTASQWMFAVDDPDLPTAIGATPVPATGARPWTDDYSSLVQALR